MMKNKIRKLIFSTITLVSLSAFAGWNDCPEGISEGQLTQWRETLVSKILAGEEAPALSAVENCFGSKPPACYEDLVYYVRNKTSPIGSDRPYEKSELTITYDDLPPEFRAEDGRVKMPQNIEQLAKERGWKMLTYKTRSTGGFDTPPNLLIVSISTPEKEIIIQTQLKSDANPGATMNNPVPHPSNGNISVGQGTLTVITADKRTYPPSGQMRIMNGSGETGYTWNDDIRSCYGCHASPFRPISPIGYRHTNGDEKKMSPEQEKTTDEINAVLSSYVTWGKRYFNGREVRLGQPLEAQSWGWAPENSPTRKEDFLKSCAGNETDISYSGFGGYPAKFKMKNPPQINYANVAKAMNCVECHNDRNRGRLTERFSTEELQFKIVVDQSMPTNVKLNTDERIALYNCLQAEFSQLRETWRKSGDWMKENSCRGQQFTTPPVLPLGGGQSQPPTGGGSAATPQ